MLSIKNVLKKIEHALKNMHLAMSWTNAYRLIVIKQNLIGILPQINVKLALMAPFIIIYLIFVKKILVQEALVYVIKISLYGTLNIWDVKHVHKENNGTPSNLHVFQNYQATRIDIPYKIQINSIILCNNTYMDIFTEIHR